MGYDGSGGYNRVHNWVTDKNAAVKITASRMDAEFDDFASAMELCLLKDGQQNPTANLPMNSKKHTGVAAASARSEYADVGSYQDGAWVWGGVASGASAITIGLSPTITAITTGMNLLFVSASANASAVTLSPDGVTAASIVSYYGSALQAGDIGSAVPIYVVSDGSKWYMQNPIKNPDYLSLDVDNINIDGNTILTTNTNGSLVLTADGSGRVQVSNTLSLGNNHVLIGNGNGVVDGDGDEMLLFLEAAGTPVNYITIGNAATGNGPTLAAAGSDTNVDLNLTPQAAGKVVIDNHSWPNADAAAGRVPATDGSGALAFQQALVQVASTQTGAVSTGTTLIPSSGGIDDTIPQNTEGDEYMTLAITPQNTNNTLVIQVVFNYACTVNGSFTVALFQDSTANALAAVVNPQADGASGNVMQTISFAHIMTAGTTSSTTFKVRAGGDTANTTTFNGFSGNRKHGGTLASSIVITEYSA